MYEGEIKRAGDTVKIRTYPDITVSRYSKGQELDTSLPDSSEKTLNIDKGYYFNFLIDDVDEVQSDINLVNAFSDTAAKQLQENIDADVLQNTYSSASSNNSNSATAGKDSSSYNLGVTGTPIQATKVNIIDLIEDCACVLDEQSVPEEKRWICFPPMIAGLIDKSDLKSADMTGDSQSIMRTRRIGKISDMDVWVTRQLAGGNTSSTGYYCLFGHPIAITFASQLVKNESIRSEKTFGVKIRGLEVYGYDVVKAEALGYLLAYK